MTEHAQDEATASGAALPAWRQVPRGWVPLSGRAESDIEHRVLGALAAVSAGTGLDVLRSLLDPESGHAAALALWPHEGTSPSTGDLYLLAVAGAAVGPVAAARLTQPGPLREGLLRSQAKLADVGGLEMAGPDTLEQMDRFAHEVRTALAGSTLTAARADGAAAWLAARMLPDLFAPRWSAASALGAVPRTHGAWLVYRAALSTPGTRVALSELAAACGRSEAPGPVLLELVVEAAARAGRR